MCGIAGSIAHPLDIPLLTRDLWHRGPDDQQTMTEDGLCLHHHRLSIVDIAGGKQPMQYGPLTLIFNGEIYNHLEVRERYGLKCATGSDTETILHAYTLRGAACLDDFDGMFALAIYNRERNELFIARDRAGKKPLYYFSDGRSFVFASELKALHSQLRLQADEENLANYIRLGFFYRSATPYKNVKELPAGCYANISLSNPQPVITRWWKIEDYYLRRSDLSEREAIDKVDSILHHAIRNRVLSSDLEVGSFLSGGIDSGLVTAIAQQYNSSLKTFTVSFDGEYDEAPLAKLVAERYGTKHHELKISFNNLKEDTENILAAYGEPHFDDSAIPSYYVSREAKRHLTVILNGDGGDELFAGYRRYVPFAKMDFFNPAPLRNSMFALLHRLTPSTRGKMNKLNYLKRLLFLGSRNGTDTYLASTTDIFEGFEKQVFKGQVPEENQMHIDFSGIINAPLSGLQKLMMMDFEALLPALLLVKMDIATMAHSLEGRSPFLCRELLQLVPSLNDDLKIRGTTTKYMLRKLAEKYLPDQLINQPKRGFEPPLRNWVENDLREMIGDYLNSSNACYPGYVNKSFVNNLLNNRVKVSAEKRAKMLWLLFTLEVWNSKVYKQ